MMMMKTDRLTEGDSYNFPDGNQSIDRHEGNPHALANSPSCFAFCDFIKCYISFFSININSAVYLVCCRDYQNKFRLCEHIGT